jgi:pimeloyl-ACP methyl ester carboxylesterase
MTANISGATLSYSDIGTGVPLMCVHGGMGIDARSLHAPGILDLAGHRIRLIIPDQRPRQRQGSERKPISGAQRPPRKN